MDIDKGKTLGILVFVSRIFLAFIMLWGFADKMFGLGFETPAGQGMINGVSPSSFVIYCTGGIFQDFFNSIAGNAVADFLMMTGMLGIGLTLLLGIAPRFTCIVFSIFLVFMYAICVPPTDNPLVDYHLSWILLTWIIYFADGFRRYSLYDRWVKLPIVRDLWILQ